MFVNHRTVLLLDEEKCVQIELFLLFRLCQVFTAWPRNGSINIGNGGSKGKKTAQSN